MSDFLKLGEKIINKPSGVDYDLVKGRVYNLKFERYEQTSYLEEDGGLNLPTKTYLTESDSTFIDKVTTFFQKTDRNTVGVTLDGCHHELLLIWKMLKIDQLCLDGWFSTRTAMSVLRCMCCSCIGALMALRSA